MKIGRPPYVLQVTDKRIFKNFQILRKCCAYLIVIKTDDVDFFKSQGQLQQIEHNIYLS